MPGRKHRIGVSTLVSAVVALVSAAESVASLACELKRYRSGTGRAADESDRTDDREEAGGGNDA